MTTRQKVILISALAFLGVLVAWYLVETPTPVVEVKQSDEGWIMTFTTRRVIKLLPWGGGLVE